MTKLIVATPVALAATTAGVRAKVYPSRAINLVVPAASGGPTDTIARILAEHMRATFGQPVIVENVPGAAGTNGVGRVARAAPDGYTIRIGLSRTHVKNGAIYKLPYGVLAEFAPIALISNSPTLIVSKTAAPPKDLQHVMRRLRN